MEEQIFIKNLKCRSLNKTKSFSLLMQEKVYAMADG
jgi:hypothetical protein